jgi:tetratricopeptide (TPR) repeat protein
MILIMMLLALPGTAQQPAAVGTHSAPLDTMTRGVPRDGERDARYQGGNIPISRKLLPQVTATTVPQARTPNQPPRLTDPMAGSWHFHLARQAAESGDAVRAKQAVASARQADPGKAHYQWWQASEAFKQVDTPTLTQVIPDIIRTLGQSTLARGRLAVKTHQVFLLATGWFWMVIVVGLYLSRWRHIAHDLGAMIFKNPRHPLRPWLPLLLPVVFLVLKPGWYGWLALMSIPLLIQTRGAARALLAVVWVTVLALVYPAWPVLRHAAPALDPQSEVVLLERACNLPPSGPIADSLRQRLAAAEEPLRQDRLAVALGIQEARRGNYKRSDELFQRVLRHDPVNYPAMLGTANNTYYRGRLDDAARQYKKAVEAHPDRGEAHFNLAQVYFKKLFVPEAADALEQARKLGFRLESAANASTPTQGYSPVVYPPLTEEAMGAACRFEAGGYEPLVTIFAWRGFLSSLPWPLFLIVGLPLVVATLLVMWVSHQNDPSDCDNCGQPLCRDCAHVLDGAWLCSGCGETAQRSKSDMVLATLFKNKSRSEGMKHIQRVVNLGRSLPGAGHLVSGRLLAGWFRLSLVALGLFLLSGGWVFDPGAEWASPGMLMPSELIHPLYLPLPVGAWSGWTGLSFLAGMGCLALAWGIALTDGPRLRKCIPERTSLVPNGAHKDKTVPAAADTYQGLGSRLGV